MSSPQTNPLLISDGLMAYDAVLPEHVTPAVDTLLSEADAVVSAVVHNQAPPTWQNVVDPLNAIMERFGRAWGVVGHLSSVMDTPELRAVYNENLPRVTEFFTLLGQNLALFERYKLLAASDSFAELIDTQQRVLQNELRDFRLSGAELSDADKVKFAKVQEVKAQLAQEFSEHILDATNDFAYVTNDVAELAGLPEDEIDAAKARAQAANQEGYRITLHMPSYFPVMQYGENRALRETLYRAYVTRASELGAKPEWDNSGHINQLIQLKQEKAQLLGFETYADLSLFTKMADSPQQVIEFLRDLASRAKSYAQNDIAELTAFAKAHLSLTGLQAWDVAYVSEKLRQHRYAFSEHEVKQYFPEEKVLSGLFNVIHGLYGITVLPDVAPVWHPDVRFYRLQDAQGQLVGQFYLDPYAREGKRGGAWMDDARGRRETPKGLQTPIAYLVCNYASPVGDKPALLTHDDVITLFHEMGHGLHHLLTTVNEPGISGIQGVEWDAVELPSQFMENFCWEWDVLQQMTAHVDSGESLPRALFDKMIAAKNFQSGMQTLRQVEFALFDMNIHYKFDPNRERVQDILNFVRQEVAVLIPPSFNRFQHSFSHIFAGGYSAGYYSYKWAEVLSADAYSCFEASAEETKTVLNPQIGAKFRENVLAMGGSRPALASFIAFCGRAPTIDALLRHHGMSDVGNESVVSTS
jgi:oligopeptidase A